MRVVIPPLGNEFIGMVKPTSLASVIQYPEMLHNAENIYYANSRVIELLIVAGLWYLLVVSVLTLVADAGGAALRAAASSRRPAPMTRPAVAIRDVRSRSAAITRSAASRSTCGKARCCA